MEERYHGMDEPVQERQSDVVRAYDNLISRNQSTIDRTLAVIEKSLTASSESNKLRKYGGYILLCGVVLIVAILAFYGKVEGSAATGILGAVVGHLFANVNK